MQGPEGNAETLAAGAAAPDGANMADQPKRREVHVLIVDDDVATRDVLEDILDEAGYIVLTAACGEDAVTILNAQSVDLVLTDMRMPGQDGLDVLEETKRVRPEADVIVMTGYASVDMAVECMKHGAADFITKPFNIDHIRMIADRTLATKALKAKAAQTEYYQSLALTDGLTNIYNKRYFLQLLDTEIARSARKGHSFVLVMLDIDNFKSFNDTNGHLAGDEALKKVAGVLDQVSRTSDNVARFGGEEFALILPEMSRVDGQRAAERLRNVIENTDIPGEDKMIGGKLTVSLGLAVYPDDAGEGTLLIDRADRALYAAKFAGKNLVRTWTDVQE